MKVFLSIFFGKLRLKVHYQFLIVVYNLFVKYPAVKAIIPVATMDKFIELLALEFEAIGTDRASPLTEKIEASDGRIDSFLTTIRLYIEIGLRSTNPLVVEAAKTLHKHIEAFGNIRDESYSAESSSVQKLVIDLQGTYKGESATVGIQDTVNELAAEEAVFTSLLEQRNSETDHPKINIRTLRHDLEGLYRNMLVMLENDILVNGPAKTAEFSFQLNKDIKRYNDENHHVPKGIEHVLVANFGDQTYTGKAITPIPEVHFVEEGHPTVELTFSVDFDLTYKNNINAGAAEMIIHGKGNYKGQKVIPFNIARTV